MKKLPVTPQSLLSAAEITAIELGEEASKLIAMNQKFLKMLESHPDNEQFQDKAREGIERIISRIKNLIKIHQEKIQSEEEKQAKKAQQIKRQKEASKATLQKMDQEVGPNLEACRTALKEYRKQVQSEKEPKPQKTRITKLKERLLGLISLIPKEKKEDEKVLDQTEEILLDTLHRLTDLWGMSRIHPAEKAITEKFDQLESKAQS